jgi:hypothetical protein
MPRGDWGDSFANAYTSSLERVSGLIARKNEFDQTMQMKQKELDSEAANRNLKAQQDMGQFQQQQQIEMMKLGYAPSKISTESFNKLSPGKPPAPGQYVTMGNQLYRKTAGLGKPADSKEALGRLSPEQQIAAWQIAKNVGGTRSAEKMVDTVAAAIGAGMSRDQIEDNLRYSSQSGQFNEQVRNAAQTLTIGQSESNRNSNYDALDDFVQKKDMVGMKDYLKRMSLDKATADQKNVIMGKERTVDFLNEIKGDLKILEDSGEAPGFFRGNYENILAKVGQVRSPEMRTVATKIATALMSFRRSMTGVQFTEAESKEYKSMFPNINKVGDFNTANINALTNTFGGDVSKFYEQSMGASNYKKIFGGVEQKLKTSSGMGYKVE